MDPNGSEWIQMGPDTSKNFRKLFKTFKISNELFKKKLYSILGIKKIHNYYGLVEQTGSIFFECEYGNLHASIYSDIFILREKL